MVQQMKKLKVVTLGDGAVGKTCMLVTYTTSAFPHDYVPTVFDNYTANLAYNDEKYHIELWDTAGQEDYDNIRKLSYEFTDVYIICYSCNSDDSAKNIQNKWFEEIKKFHKDKIPPILIVGTKSDLKEDAVKEGTWVNDNRINDIMNNLVDQNNNKIISKHLTCSAAKMIGLNEIFISAIELHLLSKDNNVQEIHRSACLCSIW